MKYAISAATGHLGQGVIRQLQKLVPDTEIVAIVRNSEKAKQLLPTNIEVRQADYTDQSAMEKALTSIDRLLFISSVPNGDTPRQSQHANVIKAAENAGVQYVAYTSFAKADTATSPLSADHVATEKMIKESGLSYSFLRNAWYLENESAYFKAALAGQNAVYAAGNGKISYALEREYAEAAADVLVTKNPKRVYEFGGQPATYQDLQDALRKATNNSFSFKSVSDDEYYQGLIDAGMDQQFANVLLSMQIMMRENELNVNSNDLPDVLGHPVASLAEAVQEVINGLK
ncbi:SDR family oxidoreductase [Lactiplantibacillus sp. WILCCON 0030]|uniref:SDR family oxidoreductase n=1 Tax=Lactiplantibacillus brownii TaxID=3069269 RepID=A0ABU1AB67_9LACO|nr:SDR family oxidoreductase [Lactiplantibacillus brownii]MDQ7938226.1 SDR family oxidoreductase [Lactiplantibacillus brownii]